MLLRLGVVAGGPDDPPDTGTPVRVEVRDVTELDAPSIVVAAVDAEVGERDRRAGGPLAIVELELPNDAVGSQADLVVWARVASSGAERTAPGDWITTQSIPVDLSAAPDALLDVEVRRVG